MGLSSLIHAEVSHQIYLFLSILDEHLLAEQISRQFDRDLAVLLMYMFKSLQLGAQLFLRTKSL